MRTVNFYETWSRQQDEEVRSEFWKVLEYGLHITEEQRKLIYVVFFTNHPINLTEFAREKGLIMSKLAAAPKFYPGMPSGNVLQQVMASYTDLVDYDHFAETAAPWLNRTRSDDPEVIERAVFGTGFESWFRANQASKNGKRSLVRAAAIRMMKTGEFRERIIRPRAEIGIEIIRYVAGDNADKEGIPLGTTMFESFIRFGLRPQFHPTDSLEFPDFRMPIKEYVKLVGVLGKESVQNYINGEGFIALRPTEKEAALLKQLKHEGFDYEVKDPKNIILALPLQLTAQFKREDLKEREKDLVKEGLHSSDHDVKKASIDAYYNAHEGLFKNYGARYYYRAKLLAEILDIPFKGRLEDFENFSCDEARKLLKAYSEGGYRTEIGSYIRSRRVELFSIYLTEWLRPFNGEQIKELLGWLNDVIDDLEFALSVRISVLMSRRSVNK